jgi:predicted metalloprotease with PDZ domain
MLRPYRIACPAVLIALLLAACEPETLKGPVAIYNGPPPPKHGLLGASFPPDEKGPAVVADILPGTPAQEAGIAKGDVITSVGGKAVTTAEEARAHLADTKPGETVTIGYTREGAAAEASVRLLSFEEVMILAAKRDRAAGGAPAPPPPQ